MLSSQMNLFAFTCKSLLGLWPLPAGVDDTTATADWVDGFSNLLVHLLLSILSCLMLTGYA